MCVGVLTTHSPWSCFSFSLCSDAQPHTMWAAQTSILSWKPTLLKSCGNSLNTASSSSSSASASASVSSASARFSCLCASTLSCSRHGYARNASWATSRGLSTAWLLGSVGGRVREREALRGSGRRHGGRSGLPVCATAELERNESSVEAKEFRIDWIPRILLAVVIGVAVWLIRLPSLAFAGVETPAFVVGGDAAAHGGNGLLSREFAKNGGGLLASAWTGLVAGGLHTLTGPDHLAALAPLCIGRSRLQSFSVGALWGCGHDAGQVIFGIIFLLLKDRLHLGIIQTWAARVVGLTLITIGALGIKEAQEIEKAAPAVAPESTMSAEIPIKKPIGPATFITGIVYGLQPDALLMVLPALSLPSRAAGAAFLGMFLLGTVLAMGSYTAFVSSLSKALQKRVPKITHQLTVGSSLIAIGLGLAVLGGEIFGMNLF